MRGSEKKMKMRRMQEKSKRKEKFIKCNKINERILFAIPSQTLAEEEQTERKLVPQRGRQRSYRGAPTE